LDLLLDTHMFLWWLSGDGAVSNPARAAIEDFGDTIFVSAAAAWETATKFCIGKLAGAAALVADLAGVVAAQGSMRLSISFGHGQAAAGALPGPHKDSFDRMLMAQAMLDDMILVSNEQRFDAYGVRRLW
jgi:PIN domain nuclease of toxin-antitoxin system